ncbi:flagellar basal body-associated FliL family protein [Desulfobulbus alkaliphilus]|uniref:flagellar basal body-associated FliL family protein n=1 Tax=Desulfobulbus alkaliphilus TaxID=869814 RepID=UPI0019666EC7|nr:flagellar basal body-associated protein FliL [Desulfobulbus alkaliphilus]MBM9537425.1 flagellar basal body-associated FliL family protein [Desulfobulbus alkaliphilus]
MAEKEKKQDSKGGKKKLMLLVAMAVFLLGAGGAAYYFLVMKKAQDIDPSKAASLISPPPSQAHIGPMVEVREFIVNIIGVDTPHYVKAAMVLELDRQSTVDEVNRRMPQIRDAILLLIGNKTFEELQDIQGKNQVKAEVKAKINSFLVTGRVDNVYLTDFVVQ